MPRYICKLQDGDKSYYLEWSTLVDAPVTYGMSREEFEEHYRHRYGSEGMRDFAERMERVEAKGVSAHHEDNVESVVSGNRAGKNETCLSMEQIIECYCRNPGSEKETLGKRWNHEMESWEEAN